MKGNNELRLNDATVIEALQEYFDKRFTGAPVRVTSVKRESSGYDSTFIVLVEERSPEGVVAARIAEIAHQDWVELAVSAKEEAA